MILISSSSPAMRSISRSFVDTIFFPLTFYNTNRFLPLQISSGTKYLVSPRKITAHNADWGA
jgi:hypothetical protein